MDLQFLGATDTVTGSKYLLREGGASVLVDCGLFQGYKQLRLRNWTPLPVPAASIDAVILTHAHLDHSGYLPLLARQGFRGKVYCTPATRDLCRILLPDSGHLLEEEAEYLNRHQLSKHAPALPLYTREDALRCLKLFHPVGYGKAWQPAPGLHACLTPSGHMLGSSFVHIDNGRRDPALLRRPGPPARPGAQAARAHAGRRLPGGRIDLWRPPARRNRPAAAARRRHQPHAARGGVVVIPAFAVGRAQTMLHCHPAAQGARRDPARCRCT